MPEYFKIGKLVASHGTAGDLILQHSLGKKTTLKGLEAIFIEEQQNSFIPYFVEKASIKSENFWDISGLEEVQIELTTDKLWIVICQLPVHFRTMKFSKFVEIVTISMEM